MTQAEIEKLAEGLSEAQKLALADKVGTPSEYFRKHGGVLFAAGLCEIVGPLTGHTTTRLTNRGSAIRQHLLKQERGDG